MSEISEIKNQYATCHELDFDDAKNTNQLRVFRNMPGLVSFQVRSHSNISKSLASKAKSKFMISTTTVNKEQLAQLIIDLKEAYKEL